MTEHDHSPLPWYVDNRVGRICIIASDNDLVAERTAPTGKDLHNARLIVAAVNSHADLLATAKWATSLIDGRIWPKQKMGLQTAIRKVEQV